MKNMRYCDTVGRCERFKNFKTLKNTDIMRKILTVNDMKKIARRKVPRMFFDYCESGSWTESTKRVNESDFDRARFKQKILVDMTNRNVATKIIGENSSMPLVLAPTGFCGMQHANGEILAAKAAEKAGVPFCLSTMSICSMEQVAKEVSSPFWFQLYMMKDRYVLVETHNTTHLHTYIL